MLRVELDFVGFKSGSIGWKMKIGKSNVVKGKGHEGRYIRNFLVGVFKRVTQGQLFKWEQRAICYRPSIPSFMYTLYFSEKHIRAPPLKMPRDILVSSPATGH